MLKSITKTDCPFQHLCCRHWWGLCLWSLWSDLWSASSPCHNIKSETSFFLINTTPNNHLNALLCLLAIQIFLRKYGIRFQSLCSMKIHLTRKAKHYRLTGFSISCINSRSSQQNNYNIRYFLFLILKKPQIWNSDNTIPRTLLSNKLI